MHRWIFRICPPGASVASIPLVFLSLAIVAIFQLPAHVFMQSGYLMAGVAANELVAIAGVPLALIRWLRFDASRLVAVGRPTLPLAVAVIVLTLGAAILMDCGMAASELLIPKTQRVAPIYDKLMAVSGGFDVVLKFIVLCILPAVCEEIYFRGFCQRSIAARWGGRRALLITAAMFALLHGHPYYLHLYFLLGLYLGAIAIATNSLWAAILCHFLNNSWTFIYHLVEVPSLKVGGAIFVLCLFVGALLATMGAFVLLRERKLARRRVELSI